MTTWKKWNRLSLATSLAALLLLLVLAGLTAAETARASQTGSEEGLAGAALWQAIENAYHDGDRGRLVALGKQVSVEQEDTFGRILTSFDTGERSTPRRIARVAAPAVGINGAACAYATIGDAIAAASDGDTIYIPGGNTYAEQLGTLSDDLTFIAALADCSGPDPGGITNSVTIDGGGASGGIWGGIADIAPGTTVTFTHIRLFDASANYGGILYVDDGATLVLNESEVEAGVATNFGGGVRVYRNGTLLAHGSYIHRNSVTGAPGGGGGVAVYQGAVTMTAGSTIGLGDGGNTSADQGGGAYLESSTLYLDDSFVIGNSAASQGGGLLAFGTSTVELYGYARIGGYFDVFSNSAAYGGGAYILGSTGLSLHDASGVIKNQATYDGGGVHASLGARATLQDGTTEVLSNTAGWNGGGLYLTDQDTRLELVSGGGRIEGNHADGSVNRGGGGIYVTGGASVQAASAYVGGNTTGVNGGGIHVAQDGVITPTNVTLTGDTVITHNQAVLGGGLYIRHDGSQVTLDSSRVEENVATLTGGGIRLFGDSALTVGGNSALIGNRAGTYGGGLAMYTGTATLEDVTFQYNEANSSGGGILQSRGSLTATDLDIRFNTASDDGGGIYRSGGTLLLAAADASSYLAVNDATRGGGLFDISGSTTEIRALGGVPFNLNTNAASDLGGAVYLTNTTTPQVLGDVIISTNAATNDGGAFFVGGGTLRLAGDANGALELGGANAALNGSGGGIFATAGALILLDNVRVGSPATGNSAALDGGGIFASGSTLELKDVRVVGNHADDDGGGIAAVEGSTVYVGTSYGDATPACDPATLAANAYCSEFNGNEAVGWGAGLYLDHSTAQITDTAFLSNTGINDGVSPGTAILLGQESSVEVSNGLFSGHGTNNNTAVHLYADAVYDSHNSTYAGNLNSPLYVVGTAAVTLTNNILWDNGGDAFFQSGATLTSSCNDAQSALGGPGDISADPLFVTTARGDYRLGAGSPAVDACSGTLAHDLDDGPRPINGDGTASSSEYDMGAFERPYSLFLPLLLRNGPN